MKKIILSVVLLIAVTTQVYAQSFTLVQPVNGYKLVKIFDKSGLAADEKVVNLLMDDKGNIIGVETSKAYYKLVAQ